MHRNIKAYNGKADALAELRRHEEAVECYEKAIKLRFGGSGSHGNNGKGDHMMYCGKGFSLAALGRYEEAVQCYDKAIGLEGRDIKVYKSKGGCIGRDWAV